MVLHIRQCNAMHLFLSSAIECGSGLICGFQTINGKSKDLSPLKRSCIQTANLSHHIQFVFERKACPDHVQVYVCEDILNLRTYLKFQE